MAAGSSALLPLLPRRDDVDTRKEPSVENEHEGYYQFVKEIIANQASSYSSVTDWLPMYRQVASSSDIDLFIYGISEKEAIDKILHIESIVRKNQRLTPDTGMALRTENAITFISPRWPYRHVQVKLSRVPTWREMPALIADRP